jgi:hypothetical protein
MILQYRRASIAALLLLFSIVGLALAQDDSPETIVTRAAHNELTARDQHPFRYTLYKINEDGRSTTKEIIETKDGDVARLIAVGGKPLTPDAESVEVERLQTLLTHPEIQAHRRKREQADANRGNELVRLLPNAFIYHLEGMADGPNGPCYRFSMTPNPSFKPPDRAAEVFAGMAGELWIDKKQERMVKFQAHLISDVNFAWGIAAKLYKGGTILVDQEDVGEKHWEQPMFKLSLTGKILLIKSLTYDTTEKESDYSPVPSNWGYQDAIKALLSEHH